MYKVTQVTLLANIYPIEKHFTIAKKQYINFPPSWYPSSPHLYLALEDFKFSHFKRSTPLLCISFFKSAYQRFYFSVHTQKW